MGQNSEKSDAAAGLKNRYLPLIDSTKVDTMRLVASKDHEKQNVCHTLQNQILAWVEHYKIVAANQANATNNGLDGHLCWLVLSELAKPRPPGEENSERFFRAEELLSAIPDDNRKVNDDLKKRLGAVLKAALNKNLIKETQRGRKRTRGYAVVGLCHLNYLSDCAAV